MALAVQPALNEDSYISVEPFTNILVHNDTKSNADTQHNLQTTIGFSSPGEKFPDDPITSVTAVLVLDAVQGGILPLVTLSGVIMNVINMVVFLRQGLSDRINLLLFSLALADTGYITNSMFYRLHTLLSLLDPALGEFWKWKVNRHICIGIYKGFHSASSCLTLLISLERCVCVLWPLKAKTLLSARRMAVVVVLIFLVCLGTSSLVSFKYQTGSYWDPHTNSTVYYSKTSRFFHENPLVVNVMANGISNQSLPTICVSGVMLATILISLRMRDVLSWRKQSAHVGTDKTMTSSEQRESLVTRMLMVVCVMFTVCTTPSVIHAFFRFSMPDFDIGARYNNTFHVTVSLMHTMAAINSSGNFLIYWAMSTKFKDILRHLVVCHATKRHTDDK